MPKSSPAKLKYMAAYQQKPENVEKRVERNKARRHAIAAGAARVGDGKDVAHKVALANGGSASDRNTKVESATKNRSWRKGQTGYKVPNEK